MLDAVAYIHWIFQCITMLGGKEHLGTEKRTKIKFKIDSRHSKLGWVFSFISVLI